MTYEITFNAESYDTCTNSCTVSCTLSSTNNESVENKEIALTETDIFLIENTNSNGIATFNLTNISSSLTLTATYDTNITDTVSLYYRNRYSLEGSLLCLGKRLSNNLNSMGVSGTNQNDGLSSLADEILNIEPSVGGLDLDTAISLTSSSASVSVNQSVTLTSKLTATYDDETLVDVDLSGVLQNATVKFYEGNTLLGSSTTGTDGIATYTYTPTTTGTKSLKAIFEGTDNFNDCESSTISVTVTILPSNISLVSDKSILSYYDSESAVLSATVLDNHNNPLESATVTFYDYTDSSNPTSLGTATTNSNGVATKTYDSTGVGDISIQASVGNVTSTALNIEDCIYADSTQVDVVRSGTVAYGYLNNARLSNLPSTYTVEFDMKTSTAPSSGNEHRMFWCPTNQYNGSSQPKNALITGYNYTGGLKIEFGKRINGTSSVNTNTSASANTWNNIKIAKTNNSGRCEFSINGTYKDYYSFTNMENYSEFAFTYILWSDTTFSVKNIKIKAL